VQRTVAQIPWRSNLALLDKLEDLNTGAAKLVANIKKNLGGWGYNNISH